MPVGARHPCAEPSCGHLVPRGKARCEKHERARDLERGTRHERGYTNRWAMAAKAFLMEHPLCARCVVEHQMDHSVFIQAAKVVDHVKPHKGNQELFWDESNWQPLCKPHHDRKTATEDSTFARRS